MNQICKHGKAENLLVCTGTYTIYKFKPNKIKHVVTWHKSYAKSYASAHTEAFPTESIVLMQNNYDIISEISVPTFKRIYVSFIVWYDLYTQPKVIMFCERYV